MTWDPKYFFIPMPVLYRPPIWAGVVDSDANDLLSRIKRIHDYNFGTSEKTALDLSLWSIEKAIETEEQIENSNRFLMLLLMRAWLVEETKEVRYMSCGLCGAKFKELEEYNLHASVEFIERSFFNLLYPPTPSNRNVSGENFTEVEPECSN